MNDFEIIRWAIYGLIAIVLWFLRTTIVKVQSDIESVQKDITSIKTDYVHRNDFKEFKIELRLLFDELKQSIKDIHK